MLISLVTPRLPSLRSWHLFHSLSLSSVLSFTSRRNAEAPNAHYTEHLGCKINLHFQSFVVQKMNLISRRVGTRE